MGHLWFEVHLPFHLSTRPMFLASVAAATNIAYSFLLFFGMRIETEYFGSWPGFIALGVKTLQYENRTRFLMSNEGGTITFVLACCCGCCCVDMFSDFDN